MLSNFFSLTALGGIASALELASNTTWAGNGAEHLGGIFTFTNTGGWANNTGSCTVSTTPGTWFLHGFGLNVASHGGGDDYVFYNVEEAEPETIGFLALGAADGDAPGEDWLTVNCDGGAPSAGPTLNSFPQDPRNNDFRGAVSGASGGSFIMSFPADHVPQNLTFDDPRVQITEETGGAFAVDAVLANFRDIWFSMGYGGADTPIAGSWQLQVAMT